MEVAAVREVGLSRAVLCEPRSLGTDVIRPMSVWEVPSIGGVCCTGLSVCAGGLLAGWCVVRVVEELSWVGEGRRF